MHVCLDVIKLVVLSVFTFLEVTGSENYSETTDGQELITEGLELTTEGLELTTEGLEWTTEGQELKQEEITYQVSLHLSYNDGFICGGSIISPKMVLTAAHCMYYDWGGLLPPIIITVSAGRKNLNEYALENFDVSKVTLHPAFNKITMESNLALIEINNEFPFNNLIRKVSLERQLPETQYNNCFITGWDQSSSDFEVVEVVLTDCENSPRNICTKKKNENEVVCISDAGNPLVCDGNLIGVLSVEPNCDDPSQLTIFEDVRNSMSWFDEHGLSSASVVVTCYLPLLIVPILLSM